MSDWWKAAPVAEPAKDWWQEAPVADAVADPRYDDVLGGLGVTKAKKRDMGRQLSDRLLQPQIEALDTADGKKIVMPGSVNAAIATEERLQRDPEFRAAMEPIIRERIRQQGGPQIGSIEERPDRTWSELGTDTAMLARQTLETGVALPLVEAPWNIVDALNTAGSFYGLPKQTPLPKPDALVELRAQTEAAQEEERGLRSSRTLAYDNENRPQDFLGAMGYMIENPGVLATDMASTLPAMATMALPGGLQSKIATMGAQQAGATAAEVEEAVFAQALQSMPAEEARVYAREEAMKAFGLAQIVSQAMPNLIKGGSAVESAFVRGATRQPARSLGARAGSATTKTVGEATAEGGEEGIIKGIGNVYTGRPAGEGVGGAAAMGVALGGPMGAVAGAQDLRAPARTVEEQRADMLGELLAKTMNPDAVPDVAATMRADNPEALVETLRRAVAERVPDAAPDPIIEALQAAIIQPEVSDGSAPARPVLEAGRGTGVPADGPGVRPSEAAGVATEALGRTAEDSGRPPAGADDVAGAQAEGVSRDTKVVDAEGKPLVVYHSGSFNAADGDVLEVGDGGFHLGTRQAAQERNHGKQVDDFITELEITQDEDGQWFWDSGNQESSDSFDSEAAARRDAENVAREIADNSEYDAPLTQAYVDIRNPMRVTDQGTDWREAIAEAKRLGYDGIVYRNLYEDKGKDSYIAFRPDQIKLISDAPANSPTTATATDQSAAVSAPATAAAEGVRDRQGSVPSPQITTLPDGSAFDPVPTRQEIAEDNARAAMEMGIDADGRAAPEPDFEGAYIEEDGFKRQFTKRLVPNRKGGMTTINEPVVDLSHDNLLHALAARGGVNIEAIADTASQGVTYDKRGNPKYKSDFIASKDNLPFGRVNMPAIRRVGGMNRTELWEFLRDGGWFADEIGEGNAGNRNQSAYTSDESQAAQMVYEAMQGAVIRHPTEGADARMEREYIARHNEEVAASEREWNQRYYDKGEIAEVEQRLRDEFQIEVSDADLQEAASLADLTSRALDAGVNPDALVRGDNERAGAYAARLWQQIKESGRGNDPQASERSDPGRDQGAQGGQAAAETQVPSRPQSGLFADPSPREAAEALERQRTDERNGKAGGRTDTGDGGLFDGPRPEQVDIEAPLPPIDTPSEPAANDAAESPEFVTSIKNEVTDAERAEADKDPILREAGDSNQVAVDNARAAFAKNQNIGREVVERINSTGVTKDGDGAILLVEKVNLIRASRKAARRASDPNALPGERAAARKLWDELEMRANELDIANVSIGSTIGRELQFRKLMIAADWTLQAMESKARAVRGRPLTLEESALVKQQAAEIERLTAERDAATTAAEAAAENASIAQAVRNMIAAVTGDKSRPRIEALRERAERAREAIRKAEGVKSNNRQAGAVMSPAIFTYYVEIGAYHIAKGVTDFADWVSSMKADLGDAITASVSVLRDVFDAATLAEKETRPKSKGKTTAAKPPTADEAMAAIDPLNLTHADVYNVTMGHIAAGLRGEAEIMAAAHKSLQAKLPDLTEREVRRLFSEYGKAKFPSKDEVKRVAAELRQLVQMQESIDRAVEGLAPLKSGLQRDKATQAIREKRARLNDLLKAAERKTIANPELLATYQQARATNLRNHIEDLKKQRDTGARPQRAKVPPDNAEIKALKAEREVVRAEIRAIDAAGKPQESPEAKALRARERMLQRQIVDLMQRAAGKPDKVAPTPPVNEETKRLDKIIAQFRTELAAMKEAVKPVVSPEQKFRERQGRDLQRQLGKYRERLRTGDYTKAVKVPKPLDKANRELNYQLQQAKKEFVIRQFAAEMEKRSPLAKLFGLGAESFNFARALMTSIDLSAVLRQGGFIAFGHPARGGKALAKSIVTLFSEKAAMEAEAEIQRRPNALNGNYARDKLELTDSNSVTMSTAEEAFMSRWIAFLPYDGDGGTLRASLNLITGKSSVKDAARLTRNVITSPLRASQRAFVTTLNILRADTYDALTASLAKNGDAVTVEEGKAIAAFVNTATGRANVQLYPGGKAITGLNAVFFAPRLVASRFSLLFGGPLYGGTNRTRALVAGEYARFLMGVSTVFMLGVLAHDEDDPDRFITFDPRSADFLKMKFGDTYLDPMTGLSQVTVFLARTITGETVNGKGEVKSRRRHLKLLNLWRDVPNYDAPDYGQDNGADVVYRFLRTKLAPVPGAGMNIIAGENLIGEEVTLESQAKDLVTPMSLGEVFKLVEAHGVEGAMAFTAVNMLGIGVQYRDPNKDTHAPEDTKPKDDPRVGSASQDPRL